MSLPRVLLISSNSSGRGGGERYLIFLAQGLRQLGIDVHALLSVQAYMDGWADGLSHAGVTVHRLLLTSLADRNLRFVSAACDVRQIKSISDFCDNLSPQGIVVNQQYDEDGLDYLAGALRSRCHRVVGVMHMPMTATKNQRPLGRLRGKLLSWWYARHRYRLILVSEGAQAEFEAYYPAPRPTFVVNNAAPLEEVAMVSEAGDGGDWRSELPVIGFIGQFVPQKNLDSLVAAWRGLLGESLPSRLLLVGDGPSRPQIEKALNAVASADLWRITGWIDKPELILSEIDVFVLCSHFEGLPLSLVEAAAQGITCVVTPFNGASDVAKHASWVHVASDNSTASVQSMLAQVLRNNWYRRKIPHEQLDVFRSHFSLRRMGSEVAEILGISRCTS